jgi:aspartyl-tRNA(Asn)/glutamyl-tRNA(Gln) amidotransferase subunit A
MSELAFLSVAEAGKLIRQKQLSPAELVDALLARIDRIDADYNAFIAVLADRSRKEAAEAESEIARGRYRGPLHGIPYGLKDLIDVAGLPTTCHSKLRRDHRATADATVQKRLREAGAVLVGKLSLHEFATGGPAFDLPWPPARNPWDRNLHPGGSSSGSGAAVALGMVPAALGTDTGGSVRNPATCCGIVGLKPTYGAVSRSGVFPLAFSLDHVGPITRTVEDNAVLFAAIAGHDPADPGSAERPTSDVLRDLEKGVQGLRFGLIEHFYRDDSPGQSDQVAAIERAVETLRALGAEVRPVQVAPLARWGEVGRTILQAEAYAVHQRDLQERPEDYAALTRSKLLAGAFIPASEYVKALQWRRLLTTEFMQATAEFDAVLTLSSLELPCKVDDPEEVARTYERQCRMPFNVAGAPALAVPTGFTDAGVPLGMQIVGKPFDEGMVYRVAHAFCQATGLANRRPPLAAQPAVQAAE